MGIDYVNAVVKFRFSRGKASPVFNGIVILEKDEPAFRSRCAQEALDLVRAQWRRLARKARIWKRIKDRYPLE
jgi:hypothetical protein